MNADEHDLWRQIDWLREAWTADDEYQMTKRLTKLKDALNELPEPHHTTALELHAGLCHARLIQHADHHQLLTRLQRVVTAWNRTRPPLLACDHKYQHPEHGVIECGITYRSASRLAEHRERVHGHHTPTTRPTPTAP
jgi:hypothetical protein